MNNEDLQKYIGILIIMSLVNTYNIRNYWSPVLGNDLIKSTMTVSIIFKKITPNIHFNDNLLARGFESFIHSFSSQIYKIILPWSKQSSQNEY